MFRKERQEGEMFPWGYGRTYRDDSRNVIICHPIPFNVIIRIWLEVHYWLMRGAFKARFEEVLRCECRKGYAKGFQVGHKKGFIDGYHLGVEDGQTREAVKDNFDDALNYAVRSPN